MAMRGLVCRGPWAAPAILLMTIAACGGGGAADLTMPDPALPPMWAALSVQTSVAGAWQVSVWTSPQPAVQGVNDVIYRVTDQSGAPVDDLALQVVPWMPAHGHGTSVPTTVTGKTDGYYLIKPVYLYMSGRWELRTDMQGGAGGGASNDGSESASNDGSGGAGDGSSDGITNGGDSEDSASDSVVPLVDIP
jgi:hypothetical protein